MENQSAPSRPALFDGNRRYFLSITAPTIVGRQGCAILLSNPGVELQHARISPTRNGFSIETIGGAVDVNGQVISAATMLKLGDTVKIGEVTFTYEGPSVSENAQEAKLGFDELFEKVKGSVVGIHAGNSIGSGFFVHANGLLVTNRHVVGYEKVVTIQTIDAQKYTGNVLRSFPDIDLAFIRVEGVTPYVPNFAPSAITKVGQSVLVIGHPMGLANTLTRGIISAVNREVMGNIYLQTDAAINPGNSGGPLFNDMGEIIGVATMGIGQSQGLNFAVPADFVRRKMDLFLSEESRVKRGQGSYCNICGYFSIGGVYCPNCGARYEERSGSSSASTPASQQCKNCGKIMNPGDQFCSACGTSI